MHFNGPNFSGVSEQLYFTPQFFVKNAKKITFLKKRVLCAVFIDLKCRRLQSSVADLKKHQKLEILLWINVLHILEISHFSRF